MSFRKHKVTIIKAAVNTLAVFIFCMLSKVTHAQYTDAEVFKEMNPSAERNNSLDSLKEIVPSLKNDSSKVLHLLRIANIYMWSYPDSTLTYSLAALQVAQKINFERGIVKTYHSMAQALAVKGNSVKALEIEFDALHLSNKIGNKVHISLSYFWIALNYLVSGDAHTALAYFKKLKSPDEVFLKNRELILTHIGWCYYTLNKLDSALFYVREAYRIDTVEKNQWRGPSFWMANIYFKMEKYADALTYFRKSANIGFVKKDIADDYIGMAYVFQKTGITDSCIYYAKKAINEAQNSPFFSAVIEASKLLVTSYKSQQNTDSAFKYEELMFATNESLLKAEQTRAVQSLFFIDQLRHQQETYIEQQYKNKVTTIVLIIALFTFLLIGMILWRNVRVKQKATLQIRQQKEQVENTLQALKATQSQLIQSEKEKIVAQHEKEVHELEAKALRAQMNPHFIFNCLNSIKALIQKEEQEKAALYLTTFSKLIRTVFQNSDKREITLYDEIETCRLYMQLESMRFGNKLTYEFCIDQTLDLKSIFIPALIIQPFIENAIWHGIMPRENGGTVTVSIDKTDQAVYCTIDDNGIGRASSKQNKFKNNNVTHESKGEHLTQARLDLDNLLNERDASITIIDKKDENEKALGTAVVLKFYEY